MIDDKLYYQMQRLGFTKVDYDQAHATLVQYSRQDRITYTMCTEALLRVLAGGLALSKALAYLDPSKSNDFREALRYVYGSLASTIPNYDRINRYHLQPKVLRRLTIQTYGYPKASYKEPGSTHQKRKAKKRGKA